MIDRLEKIQWIVSGLVAAVFLGMFFYPGLPAPLPDVLPPIRQVSAREFEEGMPKEKVQAHQTTARQASQGAKKVAGTSRPPEPEYRVVTKEVHELVRDKRHAVGQLKLIGARIDERSQTLQVTTISSDSYWPQLGIKEGDVVELLNGRPIPVGDTDALWDLYDEKLAELEAGGSIVLTVKRGGQLVQLVYRLGDLERLGR